MEEEEEDRDEEEEKAEKKEDAEEEENEGEEKEENENESFPSLLAFINLKSYSLDSYIRFIIGTMRYNKICSLIFIGLE